MTQTTLTLDNVGKSYVVDGRPLPVLDGISFSVERGEFVSLVGESGSGKSTLLRQLAGLERADRGRILLAGQPLRGPGLERGLVFQEPRLMPWLTVEQNVAFGLRNSGLPEAERKDRVARHIALVRLEGFERALPRQLSGGMAQRAAIARALVNEPDILLMDEPFGALDALTRAHLQDQLLEIWERRKMTAIFVTHDVEEAVYLADRIVVLAPRPGRVHKITPVPLSRPRNRTSPEFGAVRDEVVEDLKAAAPAHPQKAERSDV